MKSVVVLAALTMLTACASTPSTFAVRLHPGDDLRRELETIAKQRNLRAAYIVTCAGSVKTAALRFANRNETTTLEGPFEIVSLTGTLSPDGVHLHASFSDRDGRTIGGHLTEGSIIYTTAEIVIGELRGAQFLRVVDPATTYKELEIVER